MNSDSPRPTHRQRQAQETKDRVIAAARALMARNGWAGTTIDAIATEAGVAPQTIYAAFGNKRALLEGMRSVMLRDSNIPELMAQAAAESEAPHRLELWARLVRRQMETSFDVISIHRQAAASDPKVAADYRKVLDSRARVFAEFIHDLHADLAPGVSESAATDLLWCFSNEEIYRELVEERGWSADRYERWLGETLVAQLITTPSVVLREPEVQAAVARVEPA
ncbi:TetR/AcrR family transcriptional regulator [Agromyces sp. ISL-38]|uniref:TetR/AcrR family transcriptional regulator n=1 Tax=Agromyces sp. ISL-38 TaxID=2819107 RepID=UPI001BE8AB5D|nr:TetR/AcrR family transcriptional regulator [Agromyces sp. ISL-38]MBT2497480.1 TetR/AcrR family transcriptional regulator [Agromyces sp. ISL-38]MBT2517974.1 TetR/AcrR family transcriptional regulator [Streptomyces sp. ISL-90]